MAKKKSIELLEPILIDTFGLVRLRPPQPNLEDLLSATGELNEDDEKLLNRVLIKLIDNADSWNEEELKMSFISMIIIIADFDAPIRTYYDREISAEIEGHFVSSKVDMMLSKGIGDLIKTPYFFLHERTAARYKREKKYSGDPIGQMLGGMLIGQEKNNDNKPIYGCYVQGRFWFFSIMEGKNYVVSQSFDASSVDDIHKIIFILKKIKNIITERLSS